MLNGSVSDLRGDRFVQRVSPMSDETVRRLSVLGDRTEMLAQSAGALAEGARLPGQAQREQTDVSLRVERDTADTSVAGKCGAEDRKDDGVVRLARERADQIVETARADADHGRRQPPTAILADSERRARVALEYERFTADALLASERAERRKDWFECLSAARTATDGDLVGERAHTDTALLEQRGANEELVAVSLRAQQHADDADAAKELAEGGARELRAVAEFREMFIGMVGHDLRTPLGAIVMGAGTLLSRGNVNKQDAETVARIIRASQRMTRMITQLLDLTRARLGGGLPLQTGPTDLREVCRNVLEEFEVPFQVEAFGDVTGTWDEDRLEEVLSNLARNAIEHAARGTAVIVRASAAEADVVLEIENQGDPIPAEVLPFIFEPFRRGRQSEKSATGNLGLGLYIAKQVVLSHGGTLDAHSASGTTSFVIRLPRTVTHSSNEV